MTVILGIPEWECPNCMTVHRGVQTPGQPFLHNCPGLSGLTAPLVPKGQRCKVEAKVREDYVGKDTVSYDDRGQAITSVEVTRDEGNDVVVQAPCINVRTEM
jgi:hypothetical protein